MSWDIKLPLRPPSPSGARILGPERIFAPLPQPEWLVQDLIRRGSVFALVAYAGSGKTWLMIDLVCAVAVGGHWLGHLPCQRGRALLLDWENGDYELRRRLKAMGKARKQKRLNRVGLCCDAGDLDTDEFETWLMELGLFWNLIVVDPFKAAAPGIDENDSSVRMPIDRLRRVARATGCVFLLVHHAAKGTGNGDPREMARGNSAIMDAVDGALVARVLKKQEALKIECAKARFTRGAKPFCVRIDGSDLTGVSIGVVDPKETEGDDATSGTREHVLRVISQAQTPPSGSAIEKQVEGKSTRIRAVIQALVAEGVIENCGSKQHPGYRVRAVQAQANGALPAATPDTVEP